jgi:hypothetical protein
MSQPVAARARIVTQCAKARHAPRAISARAHAPSDFAALAGGLLAQPAHGLALPGRPIPSGGIIKNRSEIKG